MYTYIEDLKESSVLIKLLLQDQHKYLDIDRNNVILILYEIIRT